MHTQQCRVRILYKPGPQLYIAACFTSYNHIESKTIRYVILADDNLNALTVYVVQDWPLTRILVNEAIQPYWPFQDDIEVIEEIVMRVGES